MSIEDIIALVRSFDGALAIVAGPEDGSPEIAWGDAFFYYAPDGLMPQATQPFATIVTKNYPEDEQSGLDRPGFFRVNIAAGRGAFVEWTGHQPGGPAGHADPGMADTLFAHPVYGSQGWLAVLNPGPSTTEAATKLLRLAYDLARARYEQRINNRT